MNPTRRKARPGASMSLSRPRAIWCQRIHARAPAWRNTKGMPTPSSVTLGEHRPPPKIPSNTDPVGAPLDSTSRRRPLRHPASGACSACPPTPSSSRVWAESARSRDNWWGSPQQGWWGWQSGNEYNQGSPPAKPRSPFGQHTSPTEKPKPPPPSSIACYREGASS